MTTPNSPAPATVTVPGVGPVRRAYVVVGLVVVVGVVGYAYLRRNKRSNASVAAYETADGTLSAPIGYQNPAPTSPPSGVVDTEDGAITDNSSWSRAAIAELEGLGYNPGYVATILGRYLSGQMLTPTEADVVRAAYAAVGMPPQPVSILVQPTSPAPSTPEPDEPDTPDPSPSGPDLPAGWYMASTTGASWHGRNVPVSRITTSGTQTWATVASANGGFAPWDLYLFNGSPGAFDSPIPAGTSIAIPHP